LGDTGRSTNEHNLVNLLLLDSSILHDGGDGVKGTLEGDSVEVLETGTGNLHGEVLAVEQRVNLNGGLGTARQGPLGTLASRPKTTEGTRVAAEILLSLASELLLAVVEEVGVEVLTTKM